MNKSLIFSNGPTSLSIIPDPCMDMPNVIIAADMRGINAGAVGYGKKVLASAVGEYAERHLAYFKIDYDAIIKSNELEPSIDHAFSQLIDEKPKDFLKAVECISLFDGKKIFVPVNLVSLGVRHNDESRLNRDTSGFAIHTSLNQALKAGLSEFIERQCIMRWWLERKSNIQLYNLPHNIIFNRMKSIGELRVYDVSCSPFEGYCFFCVFFGKGRPVWFSSGLSYSNDPIEAYEKAMLELWQIYLFVYGASTGEINKKAITDSYQRSFLSYDNSNTISLFEKNTEYRDFRGMLKKDSVINELGNILKLTSNIYMYKKIVYEMNRELYLVKIFSPDFFLHIKMTARLNLNNKFANTFDSINLDQLKKDLPFP